ncbi:MAG: HEAT repeat domain-containing protein [Planctomycetes bacterium]|nr:HEAT repeat domain-containing protein [Planctomycetota bacterium]
MAIHTRSRALAMVLTLVVFGGAVAVAQQTGPSEASVTQAWRDFLHYIHVARPDVALAYGQELLKDQADARQLYTLSVETPGAYQTLARAENIESLAETVAALRKKIEEGYRQISQDPDRVLEAIDLLGGTLRQFGIGADRLKASGEYAVSMMVKRLGDSSITPLVRDRITRVLGELGREAVRPLTAALASPDPSVREAVCTALGQIGYAHAAPYLRERIADQRELDRVKAAATRALIAVTGNRQAAGVPVAQYYFDLAQTYYRGDQSILPDARFQTANVWYWGDLGVTYVEVPRAIFLDVYAMRLAREALKADKSYASAVTLWLQANLRKEANLPAGATDPTRDDAELPAAAYAKAAGAQYMQDVLAAALSAGETPVVSGAIQALRQTAGASNLASAPAGVTPLVAALTYPDRRVRLMAAETLANAMPDKPFQGSELVVAGLIESLHQTGRKTVLLIVPDSNDLNRFKDWIRAGGWDVVDAPDLGAALAKVDAMAGVDMVVIDSRVQSPGLGEAMDMIRKSPQLTLQPAVMLVAGPDLIRARQIDENDALAVMAEIDGLEAQGLQAAMATAEAAVTGDAPIGEQEAYQWVLRAASAIRLLALSGTQVFDLNRTREALEANLGGTPDDVKIACARALSVLPSGPAQQAVADLAASDPAEAVRIAAYQAAAESVRILGRQLTDGQCRAVVEVVQSTQSEAVRDAASELLGALNLPSQQIKDLILARE